MTMDLPSYKMEMFHGYVSLPEGKTVRHKNIFHNEEHRYPSLLIQPMISGSSSVCYGCHRSYCNLMYPIVNGFVENREHLNRKLAASHHSLIVMIPHEYSMIIPVYQIDSFSILTSTFSWYASMVSQYPSIILTYIASYSIQFDVLLVKIDGPVWYTIYYHLPSGKLT